MSQELRNLLDQCQALLERQNQWQTMAPSPQKLMSTAPFMVDTLSFLEWFQWVYIARLRALMEAGQPLPQGALVAPYAEESLKADGSENPELIALIRQLDELI